MLLAKATGYGIRALAYLASQPKNRLCGLQEIASHEHIPPDFLRKILGELRRHRLLRSVKGIHGGYELVREPQTITLWEVFNILEPDPHLETCLLGHDICTTERGCALREDWDRLRREVTDFLKNKTIAQIAANSIPAETSATVTHEETGHREGAEQL
ncbi:MAG: Rrf2 family transcriptional regulator [Blastocatellia bacterium]|nr:Rrf2 family transcriptional regulator [Blastocatellia bacterium]